jgi:hypothetical protein
VGLRDGLDRCGKSRPHRASIPGPSSPQAVTVPTELLCPRELPYQYLKCEITPYSTIKPRSFVLDRPVLLTVVVVIVALL